LRSSNDYCDFFLYPGIVPVALQETVREAGIEPRTDAPELESQIQKTIDIWARFHRGGIIQGVLMHNDPLENPEKIHGGVGLSQEDNTTLIVYETGPIV
jgi:hypothetical protein